MEVLTNFPKSRERGKKDVLHAKFYESYYGETKGNNIMSMSYTSFIRLVSQKLLVAPETIERHCRKAMETNPHLRGFDYDKRKQMQKSVSYEQSTMNLH